MESGILTGMGLGGIDLFFLFLFPVLLCLVLFILLLLLWSKHRKLAEKYDRFLRGSDAQSLEEDIFRLFDENDQIGEELKAHRRELRHIRQTLSHTFMKIGLVKYDAFSQMGGKMSYVLALLDEQDNGFLMNTVHSTENCYSYVKQVVGGQVGVDLGVEEREALNEALGNEEQ